MNILLWFRARLHPWKCSDRFGGGHPWRWIPGGLGPEEIFQGANSSGARSADVIEGTGLGRVLDLVDEVFDQQRSFVC